MNSWRRRLVVVALGVWVAVPAAQAPQSSLAADLERVRAEYGLPAMAAARFTSEGAPDVAAVGVRRAGADVAVTPNDLWHIGSITKSFTSMLVARLVERGELSWTTTLRDLLGDEAGAYGPVTVAHLLGHRSGLPANATPAMLATGTPGGPTDVVAIRRRVTREALKTTPSGPAGTPFLYSNLGYAVLASALETRTGRSWEDQLQAEVLVPLSLTSAGHGPPGIVTELTQPRGHRGGKAPVEPGPFADNPPYMGPAGRLHMTVGDLARWGQIHLRGARAQDGLVTATTFVRMHTPLASDNAYAMGWVRDAGSSSPMVWHNGSNTLWYGFVAFVPGKDLGLAVVSNGGIEARTAVEAFARGVLR